MDTSNYMDYFSSPEEFIRVHTTSRSKYSVIDKDDLIWIAEQSYGITADKKMTSSQILDMILEKTSLEEFSEHLDYGVRSNSFQQKFDISHDEVKRMARLGFIQVTGSMRVRLYGKWRNVNLYSVFDYFRLTKEAVHKWLEENPKGTKKKNITVDSEDKNGD
ncbi:MAG: hypothetical protein NC489_07860 [Ruminococcus flavefaciens]|nr:hypothetical protein [Ruminococcus flavefaciens]